ncbi:hypothetical protein [Chitinophaga sp. 212800010-3]|uniref:hypothetical protein n=1 Tax=unclassified Chitinophaga TaxID=2619133 RepID=UPI002DF0BB64|nr:hypothetical protein [Chitinophaga sp. 212800010-3]
MKKVLLGVAALALFAAACKNDKKDDITPVPTTEDWNISGAVDTDNDSLIYTYNADKSINTIEEATVNNPDGYYRLFRFSYDNGKPVRVTIKKKKTDTEVTYKQFVYSGNRLVRIDNFFDIMDQATSIAASRDTLVYENDKLVKVEKGAGNGSDRKREFTWTGNSITAEKEYRPVNNTLTLSYNRTFTYSDKANPAKTLSYAYFLIGDQSNTYNLSDNFITSRKVINHLGVPDGEYTWGRSFDNKGLMLTDTTTYKSGSGGKTETYVTRYKYIDLNKK